MASPESDSIVLFFPEHRKSKGLGHFRRSFYLAKQLNASIYLPFLHEDSYSIAELNEKFPGATEYVVHEIPGAVNWFVYDIPWIDKKDVRFSACPDEAWNKAGRIGIDCGGSGRDAMHYLIDTLPRIDNRNEQGANCFADPVLDDIPSRHNSSRPELAVADAGTAKGILIVFGAEDYNKTANTVLMQIASSQAADSSARSVDLYVIGECIAADIQYTSLAFDPNLANTFCNYDLVITHFGLTAYEAAAAGCEVLLVNPSDYHSRLSRAAGFSETTINQIGADLNSWLAGTLAFKAQVQEGEKLVPILQDVTSRSHVQCPLCGSNDNSITYRYETKSYAECKSCGLMHLFPLRVPKIEYNESYFFEAYEQQYGKTYLDDFDHIKNMGLGRVAAIQSLVHVYSASSGGVEKPCILDIGCAYGPFLSAAKDAGFEAYGTDIAEKAVEYCNSLGFKAKQADFRSDNVAALFGLNAFDAISMWYVIEHFERLDIVLQSVHRLLDTGGIFAFSTPSASGVSGRFNTVDFYKKSPDDHYSILDSRLIKRQLAQFGFQLEKIVSTGHHPERFSRIFESGRLLYSPGMALSKLLKLGDTCEIYARKINLNE